MIDKARLRAALALKEMSCKELAERLGIDYVTLWRKINGKSDFTRREIQMICKELEIESTEMERIFFNEKLA